MKNKILHLLFYFGVFASCFIFLFTLNAKADYPAVLGGGVYFSVPVTWCSAIVITKYGTSCTGTTTGYVASTSFPNSSFINWCVATGTDKTGTFCSAFASGYVSNVPFSGSAYSWCTATGVNKTGTFCAADATGYTASSPGWYFQTYSCPSGGTLSGTTCITDNGCAANTCSTTSCWNNSAWVNGTKICAADNGCAANTCSTQVCFNSIAWVQGTKCCSVCPDANTICSGVPYSDACGNSCGIGTNIPAVPTLSFTANPASINNGGLSILSWSTANASTCSWYTNNVLNGPIAAAGGTQSVSPSSNTIYNAECWNSCNVSSGRKDAQVSVCTPNYINYSCILQPVDICDSSNADKTITTGKSYCSRVDTNGCSNDPLPSKSDCAAAGVTCPADTVVTCPSNSTVTAGGWREVQP